MNADRDEYRMDWRNPPQEFPQRNIMDSPVVLTALAILVIGICLIGATWGFPT